MLHFLQNRKSQVIETLAKTRFRGNSNQQPYDKRHPARATYTGYRYQLLVLTVLFLEFGLEKKEFKLGAEDARALDFDDVVAFCKDLEPTEEDPREYHTDFFQMKYTCNENEKITYKDLRKPIDEKNLNKFSLAKYFLTFLRIRSDQRFSPYSLGKFVVCTNIDFDHALKDYIEQDRNGSYSLRFSEQLHRKLILIFEDELREKVLQNKKLYGKNPYSAIDAREKDGRIVIYESTLRGEAGQSIEELMKKFFRDLRFLTGVRIDDCEQHIEQIIQKAIESPENEYIPENLVPRAIHYIEKWFCSGSSDSFLTNEEAQALLEKLKKDFSDIFRSNNLVISTNACPQPAQPVEIGAVPLPFGNKYTTTTHICWQPNSVQPGTISLPPLSPGYQYTTVTNVFWHLFPYGYQYTTTINICWQHVDQIIQSGAIPLLYGYQYTTTTNICWQPATHLIQTGTIFPSPPPGYKYTTTTNTCWQSIDQLVQPGTTALSPGYQYTTTINICRQPIEQPVQPGTTFLPPLSPGYQYTITTHVDQQPSTQLSNTASQPIQQGFLVHR